MYDLKDVIKWYLSKAEMTPKKLQKILYYAYAWYLTLQNNDPEDLQDRLFDSSFEAWVHGPVIRSVYEDYRNHGYQSIPKFEGEIPQFDPDTEDILQQVWDVYGEFNGNELETITHQEDPWINARDGYRPLDRCEEEITDISIYQYYIGLVG